MIIQTAGEIWRFWSKVSKGTSEECWQWLGEISNGYGMISLRREGRSRNRRAHRIAFELFTGKDAGPVIMHMCDNPGCVNPKHLISGSHQDNSSDMVAKGRQSAGERNGFSKLGRDDVLAIVAAVRSGQAQRSVARAWGVGPSAVSSIMNGRTWSHVTGIEPCCPGKPSGERNGRSRLTEQEVLEIYRRAQEDSVSRLAKEFGVDWGTVNNIKRRITWANVTGAPCATHEP